MLVTAEKLPVRTRLPSAAWILAATVTLFSMGASLVGKVHAASGSAPPSVERTTPQGQDAPGPDNGTSASPNTRPGETLSEQLDRNNGVITPPPTGDQDIYATAPNPNPGTTPVIPPPGTPGGDQTIQPQ